MRFNRILSTSLTILIITILFFGCGETTDTALDFQNLYEKENPGNEFGIGVAVETDNIIIKFTESVNSEFNSNSTESSKVKNKLKSIGLEPVRTLKFSGLKVMKKRPEKALKNAIEELESSGLVEYAEPDYVLNANLIPNDTDFNKLWGMNNRSNNADIDAPEAWDIETGRSDVIVAVIDTGVDYNHADLAANMWKNTREIPGNNIDDDNNGYIDDIYGIDAVNDDSDPMDDNSHGTHCSGTIGGAGNNGKGIAGVCWDVRIMALKFLSSSGSGSTSGAIECIDYAIQNGAHIMSNSWGGGGYSRGLHDAILRAEEAGILFIAAAGNSGSNNDNIPHYPSSYENENIISVAAIDSNDNLSYFSSYGKISVDVAAPGSNIYSSIPGNRYSSYSGTSMATPHVAGLAALIKSRDMALDWFTIKQRIITSVVKTTALEGKILSNGRINAYNSLKNGNTVPVPVVNITSPQDNSILNGIVQFSAAAEDIMEIIKVEFYVNDTLIAADTTMPYSCQLNTDLLGNTSHKLKATAYNSSGISSSDSITIEVNNTSDPIDTEKPVVVITSPSDGAVVGESVIISASAADNIGVQYVKLYIDNNLLVNDSTAPFTYELDTYKYPNGAYSIKAVAYDAAGNNSSDLISVSINNSSSGPGPVVHITSPANGSTVKGEVLITVNVESNSEIKEATFYINGKDIGIMRQEPFSITWDSRTVRNGKFSIKAVIKDVFNRKGSDMIKIQVLN